MNIESMPLSLEPALELWRRWTFFAGPSGSAGSDIAIAVLIFLFSALIWVLPPLFLLQFAERKFGADFQARVGPNRNGPIGFAQGLADTVKLASKAPESASFLGRSWWLSSVVLLGATLVLLPMSSLTWVTDSDWAVVVPVLLLAAACACAVIAGFAGGAVVPLLSAIRALLQTLSALFPALLSLSVVGLRAGGLSLANAIQVQGFLPTGWTFFSSPFAMVAEVVRDGQDARQGAVQEAEVIIDSCVANFIHWMESREVVPTIRALRDNAERHRRHEMEKALRLLAKGEDAAKVLESLSNGLTNKFLHAPTHTLNQVQAAERDAFLDMVHRIYHLHTPE